MFAAFLFVTLIFSPSHYWVGGQAKEQPCSTFSIDVVM
ncbi:hypothetical protein VVMO6_04163 [Vibrio vulnificus MO6-24/O]|nr:hypothetical protein VVMO6_04163 [Vibrio vulnificus MO6-24/O]